MNKFSTWVVIGLLIYVLVMVVVLAFVWKYNPMWMSLLLGLYALVSFAAGMALSYVAIKYIAKNKRE